MGHGRRLGRRLAHVHVDDDAQVVEGGHGRVEDGDDRQERQPAAALDRREDHVRLGKEAGGRRDPGQRQEEEDHQDAQRGLAAAEAGERLEAAGDARPLLERGHDGERTEIHEGVGGHVEEEALEPLELAAGVCREADHHVAGVGDRGVRQHPLDVVLGDGHEVAERHRQRREDEDHDDPLVLERGQGLGEDPQDEGERADLGPDGEVAGDRRGRALVGVGCPVVEGHGRDLEGDAGRQQGEAHREAGGEGLLALHDPAEDAGDLGDPGRAREAPDEGQAEEEDRARERAEEEVLDGALGRERVPLVIPRQQVARDDHELEAHEEDEEVGRRGHDHRAGEGEHEDGRELGHRQAARDQVVRPEEDRQGRDRDEDEVKVRRQVVHPVRAAEGGPRLLPGPQDEGGDDPEAQQRHRRREDRAPGPHDVGDDDRAGDEQGRQEGGDDGQVGKGHRQASRQRPIAVASDGSTAASTARTGPAMRSRTRAG